MARPRKSSLGLVVLASSLAAVASVGATAPTAAGPAVATDWAWVTVRNASSSVTPYAYNRGNSGGGVNTVTHNDTGDWTVTFPDVRSQDDLGVNFVTPFGRTDRLCATHAYSLLEPDLGIRVLCHDTAGVPRDTKFSLVYFNAGDSTGDLAHFWAHDSTVGTHTPNFFYNHNSSGGDNEYTVHSTGHWTIRFGGLGSTQGHIQVSPNHGTDQALPVYCQVTDWSNVNGDVEADVYCHFADGSPADTNLNVAYFDDVGLKGDGGTNVAYLFAKQKSNAGPYSPPAGRTYNSSGGIVEVTRSATGTYLATVDGMRKGGAAAITSLGSNENRCVVDSIRRNTPYQEIGVECVDTSGALSDTRFLLSYEK